MKTRRAAHFLLTSELAYSPPNDALITALLEAGYLVDLFAPGGDFPVGFYGPNVRALPAEYGYGWLGRNVFSRRWFQYSLFSGTTEDPMAVAGSLARLYRKPCITMADEIKNGTFSGNRGKRWKALCRHGMRASNFTVVNEKERVEIQREYAGLAPDHPITVYPGCFRDPPAALDRDAVRGSRGIPGDAVLVCYSGVFNEGNGGLWLAKAVREGPSDVWFWGQLVGTDRFTRSLLPLLYGADRFVLEPHRLSWREAWACMGAVDIGMVVYLQDAPQFRHMGSASNRLCMFLAMGVPVIANRQPSFEFIERYECGVLVENEAEFVHAISHVTQRLDLMRRNALRCAAEYICSPAGYRTLKQHIDRMEKA